MNTDSIAKIFSSLNDMTFNETVTELKEELGISKKTSLIEKIKNFINSVTSKEEKAPDQGVDPDTYAQQYADENGITFEEAKEELKEKHGDPEEPQKGDIDVTTFNRPETEKEKDSINVNTFNRPDKTKEKLREEHPAKPEEPERPEKPEFEKPKR